jgi:hypothetical protein
MKSSIQSFMDKIELFRASWREIALESSFAGMTLAQFEAATADSLTVRSEIEALKLQLKAKRTERANIDLITQDVLELVVNSVRGTAGFGMNSPMYRNLGYRSKLEQKTGKTNKSPTTSVTAAVSANAA